MNCAVPFHAGDKAQLLRWLLWNAELGVVKGHTLWLMPAKGLDHGEAASWAKDAFEQVEILPDYEGITGWPQGANSVFRQFAWHFYNNRLGPWLFCEPDCVPTARGWLEALEAEYRAAGKKFLGRFVPAGTVPGNIYPAHLSGNAVYPEDTPLSAQGAMMARDAAWDVVGAGEILAQAHRSLLIQHTRETFRHSLKDDSEARAMLEPAAVLYHTDKEGQMIAFLRKQRSLGNSVAVEPQTGLLFSPHSTPERTHQEEKGGDAACPTNATVTGRTENISPPVLSTDVTLSNRADTFYPEPARVRVYTYFSPVVSEKGRHEQERLLHYWDESWRSHGWTPVVLTDQDAAKHPKFEEYKAAFENMPTANPKRYEMACWLRWLAMAQCGGILTDYDCINFGFVQSDLAVWALGLTDNIRPATVIPLAKHAPCAVAGDSAAYTLALEYFVNSTEQFEERGKPHVSDMHLIAKWKWHCEDICREYGSPGWEDAKLVHFGHYSTGFKRSKVIESVLGKKQFTETVGKLSKLVSECASATDKLIDGLQKEIARRAA